MARFRQLGWVLLILVSSCAPDHQEASAIAGKRAVSLVPNVTEIIFAAGGGDHLVGVTRYCDYPPAVTKIKKIGDLQVDFETLISLAPDVVFSSEALAAKNNAEIEKLGIPVERLDASDFSGLLLEMKRVGELLGCEEASAHASGKIQERLHELDARRPASAVKPTVLFISTVDPLWVPGPGSHVDHLITRAGGLNVIKGKPWTQLPWEVVLEEDPMIIVVAKANLDALQNRAGWTELRAVKTSRVHCVDEGLFARFTPRSVEAYAQLITLFHEK